MKIQSRLSRSAICLAQTVLLLSGNLAFAASSTSQLDTYEKSIFGETHSLLSEDKRIKDLELNLFGKARTGSVSTRLSEISKALGGKNDNLLLPPIAPQLDTSSTSSSQLQSAQGNSPSSAPSYGSAAPSYSSSDTHSNSTASSPSSLEKDTLRSAMQLYSQGRTDEAERQFRKVLSMDMRSVDAYYNLGVIAEAKGDLQGALNNYKAAYRINPSDTELATAISGIQNKLQDKVAADQHQRQVEQQAALEQQQQRKTESLKTMISDAASAFKSGNYDQAISKLSYVSQQAPNDPDVLYALGQAYKGKGDMGRARSTFNQAIAIDPNNQLYKNALSDLSRVANNSGSSSGGNSYDGAPPTAPSYGSSTPFSGSHRGQQPGQLTSFADDSSSSSGYTNGGNDSYASQGAGAGQLTPFTGIAETSRGYSRGGLGGITSSIGGLGSMGGLGVGLLGGGLGSMLGGGVRYNGYESYNRGYGGGYGGTRLKRVAIGTVGGLAAGALYGSMSHRDVKSSAIRGALMGGAMSLFMGGF